jgi:hypothetical protein
MSELSSDDIKGVKIIAGSMVVILILVSFVVLKKCTEVETNTLTNCPVNSDYQQSIIIVDNTDKFTSTQVDYITSYVKELWENLPLYDRVTVYSFYNQSSFSPKALISICRPPSENEVSYATSNVRKVKKKFNDEFLAPLTKALLDSIQVKDLRTSPIIEFIEGVGSNAHMLYKGDIKKVIIISDMIQNTAYLNQYRNNSSKVPSHYKEFASNINSSRLFDGASFEVIYLVRERSKNIQTRGHALFWETFFRDAGGKLNSIAPIR